MRRGIYGIALALALTACAAEKEVEAPSSLLPPAEIGADGRVVDDHSMCEWQGRTDVEVRETAGPGAIQPNVRRVYAVKGVGPNRRRTILCREIDTNLDGYKDVVRLYDAEGATKEERADTNFDGKVDTWNRFAKGKLAEVSHDRNHDGKPDEWKVYIKGNLSRIKRDRNFDGEPDVWEMYRKGRLERMGVDVDMKGRIDRWDYDAEYRRELDEKDEAEAKKAREERDERDEEVRKEGEKAAAEMDDDDDDGSSEGEP